MKFGDVVRLKYMKSKFIVTFITERVVDGHTLVEVRFRGDIYVFDKNSITMDLVEDGSQLDEASL